MLCVMHRVMHGVMHRVMHGARPVVAALAVACALLVAACGFESDFDDPESPVSQIPWPDFERLHYDWLDQTDEKLGTVVMETVREDVRYRLSLMFSRETADGPVADLVTVWVDAETMAPVRYERSADAPDESLQAEADYRLNRDGTISADVSVVRTDKEEDDEEKRTKRITETVDAGVYAFDNDSSAWLWRSLAFMQDLVLTYRSVNVVHQRSQLVQVAVRGQDTLRGPDGDVVVWQVVATPGVEVSRAWYEIDPPHRLIRWDQQPRRFVLTRIETEP